MATVISNRTAELNDQLRKSAKHFGEGANVPGTIMLSSGIMTLFKDKIFFILHYVSDFDDFTEQNDPYGEHDFGALSIDYIGRVIWKIDYFADENCDSASEDPSDPTRCYRVLTIMRAHEY